MPTSDKVHFEHGSGAREYAQKNLIAFQRLWNRHNPNAKISEDGIYGPATANAFNKAPCGGWAASLEEEAPLMVDEEIQVDLTFAEALEAILQESAEEIFSEVSALE